MIRKSYPEHFEKLWLTFDLKYGGRGAKPKAFDVFSKKKVTREDVEYIIEKYLAQKEAKRQQRQGGEFSPDFQDVERYLRNERFEDEININATGLSKSDQAKHDQVRRYLEGSHGESVAGTSSRETHTEGRGGRVINFPVLEVKPR